MSFASTKNDTLKSWRRPRWMNSVTWRKPKSWWLCWRVWRINALVFAPARGAMRSLLANAQKNQNHPVLQKCQIFKSVKVAKVRAKNCIQNRECLSIKVRSTPQYCCHSLEFRRYCSRLEQELFVAVGGIRNGVMRYLPATAQAISDKGSAREVRYPPEHLGAQMFLLCRAYRAVPLLHVSGRCL